MADLNISDNAYKVLHKRYLLKDDKGNVIETPNDLFRRVAKHVANGNTEWEEKFYEIMTSLKFVPNTPTLTGAGRDMCLSACFVINPEDDINSIFDTQKKAATVFKEGGGVGYDFSSLRPSNSRVRTTQGVSSGPISFMKSYDSMCHAIKQGGTRRGAQMGILRVDHPDIEEFISSKDKENQVLSNFNISVGILDSFMDAVNSDQDWVLHHKAAPEIKKEVKAKGILRLTAERAYETGDPGLLFLDRMNRDNPVPHIGEYKATNPCVTGDTLIYVADGRTNVSIKELAEEDKDVPVFCLDNDGKIAIRTMRNPRVTGKNVNIYKVTLDDGSVVKATGNHKLRLRSGEYKRVDELRKGESVKVLSRFAGRVKSKYGKLSRKDYIFINNGLERTSEHKQIASWNFGPIKNDEVVHHINFDCQDNSPINLKAMSKADHNNLHVKGMLGDKNPMRRAKVEWSDEDWRRYSKNMSLAISGEKNGRALNVTNEKIKQHAIILTEALGHRFSKREWAKYAKENNLPSQFSSWRKSCFNGVLGLSKWAENECGINNVNCDPRTQRFYNKLLESGYDCFIYGKKVFINKRCEICSQKFIIDAYRREVGICSQKCHSIYLTSRNKSSEISKKAQKSSRDTWLKKKQENAEKQLKVYIDLKFKLGREPLKKEWEKECKKKDAPIRLAKPSYLGSYTGLKRKAADFNHKVISIELIGQEDVYNGTVDEFHNFFSSLSINGKKCSYINNLNCGEQPLIHGDSCNLGSMNVLKYFNGTGIDWDSLREDIHVCIKFLDQVVETNKYPLPEIDRISRGSRRVGLGIMGWAQLLFVLGIPYNSKKAISFTEEFMGFFRKESIAASRALGEELGNFPFHRGSVYEDASNLSPVFGDFIKENEGSITIRNATQNTIAPTGSISLIANCSSGMEPIYALVFIKEVMEGTKLFYVDPIFEKIAKDNDFYSDELIQQIYKNGGSCQGLEAVPQKYQKLFVTAMDLSPEEHVIALATFQKFIDSSISKTINMPNSATVDDIENVYKLAYELGCKGITVYRDGCKDVQVLYTGDKEKEARGRSRITISESILKKLLVEKKMSIEEAADVFDCSPSTVRRRMKEFGIETLRVKPSKLQRPEILPGSTQKLKTGEGSFLVTTNTDPNSGDLFEMTILPSKSSLDELHNCESLGRLVSLASQYGVPVEEISEQLVGITGPNPTFYNGTSIKSLPDAIGKILYRFLDKEHSVVEEGLCKSCGSENVEFSSGCFFCRDCGEGKCG